MAHTLEGKVAKILSDTCVVVNLGSMHGVHVGVVFTILAEGDEVKDPDTGETLGRWEVAKGHVLATHVQDRLSTCESCVIKPKAPEEDEDPTRRVLSAEMIQVSMRPFEDATERPKLNVDRREVAGMPQVGPVRVGDTVRAEIDLAQATNP